MHREMVGLWEAGKEVRREHRGREGGSTASLTVGTSQAQKRKELFSGQ